MIVQSELYLGAQGGTADPEKLSAGRPDSVVFNGYANQYTRDRPTARVGERVRVWVLDAGPDRAGAFHVVGGQFDTVYQGAPTGSARTTPDTAVRRSSTRPRDGEGSSSSPSRRRATTRSSRTS
ncbi:hypothetical protein [Streptomyces sp. NPDC020996]|uniref:hypothetical protein n=1 Tax=Streptomyces sp. NPDC020996 TaxID=3154791 RepID=UPI0033DD44D7